MKTWFSKYWKKLALLAAALLLGMVSSEVAYRIYTTAKYHKVLRNFSSPPWVLHPGQSFEYLMAPNTRGRLHFLTDTSRAFSYIINRDGFRGRPFDGAGPDVAKVLLLGDSYTFGWGLEEDAPRFPRLVERALNADGPTIRCLVYNAGMPGYNTEQEHHLLSRLGREHAFDLVALNYAMNDAEPQHTVPIPPRQYYRYCGLWLPERLKEILNAKLFGGRSVFHVRKSTPSFDYLVGFGPDSPKAKASRDALEGIARWCHARGIALVVFILPDVSQPLDASYPWTPIHEKVGQWGRMLGVPTFDLLPTFRDRPHHEYMIEGDGHPNARAHQLIAESILPAVRSTLGAARVRDE